MKKDKPKLFTMNENNNYSERNQYYNMMSECEKCCCSSCTGFNCPWKKQAPVGLGYYEPSPHTSHTSSVRCCICRYTFNYERILDCDYYTYYKRKRFYRVRRVKKVDKLEEIIKKLDKLLEK